MLYVHEIFNMKKVFLSLLVITGTGYCMEDTKNFFFQLRGELCDPNSKKLFGLIESLQNINSQDRYGYTALHLAVKLQHLGAVKKILSVPGVDVNMRDFEGLAVIHHVKCPQIMKELLKIPEIDIHMRDASGKTALFYKATQPNNIAAKGDIRLLRQLLKAPGIDVNARDLGGETIVHYMVYTGLSREIEQELLMVPGFNMNIRIEGGYTPVLVAFLKGRRELARNGILIGATIDLESLSELDEECKEFIKTAIRDREKMISSLQKSENATKLDSYGLGDTTILNMQDMGKQKDVQGELLFRCALLQGDISGMRYLLRLSNTLPQNMLKEAKAFYEQSRKKLPMHRIVAYQEIGRLIIGHLKYYGPEGRISKQGLWQLQFIESIELPSEVARVIARFEC